LHRPGTYVKGFVVVGLTEIAGVALTTKPTERAIGFHWRKTVVVVFGGQFHCGLNREKSNVGVIDPVIHCPVALICCFRAYKGRSMREQTHSKRNMVCWNLIVEIHRALIVIVVQEIFDQRGLVHDILNTSGWGTSLVGVS
jgi:hypothetical protein